MTEHITKADRRAILRALAYELKRIQRKPTEKQVNTQGFLSTRAIMAADVVRAYEHIRDIDPESLPSRLEEEEDDETAR